MSFVKRSPRNGSCLTAAEYGLIAALISLVVIVGAGALGNALNQKFVNIGNTASNVGS
jgi:pilus assembly protein Flp/PilA